MTMTLLWTGMTAASLLCALAGGKTQALSAAVIGGAGAAVELTAATAGMLCLWSGVMEVMARAGLIRRLSVLFGPILGFLFPSVRRDRAIMDSIAANMSANLLGLGSAATPFGLDAARRLERLSPGRASDALCMMVVCNSASIQLIPNTVIAVRAAAGSGRPFEILPAVWLASGLSVLTGILACKVLERQWKRWEKC